MQVIDLTQPLHKDIPIWPGDPKFSMTIVSNPEKDGYTLNELKIGEHTGTHIGAPSHFIPSGPSIDQVLPDNLIVPAVKIPVIPQCKRNSDYLVSKEDIINWENSNQKISAKSVVLFETGWSLYWQEPAKYLGNNTSGMHFPGITESAMQHLITRNITGVGIDTAGIDGGQSQNFAVNHLAAQYKIYHLENLTHLEKLTETGITLFIGALPLHNGSGSPCRVLATIS